MVAFINVIISHFVSKDKKKNIARVAPERNVFIDHNLIIIITMIANIYIYDIENSINMAVHHTVLHHTHVFIFYFFPLVFVWCKVA